MAHLMTLQFTRFVGRICEAMRKVHLNAFGRAGVAGGRLLAAPEVQGPREGGPQTHGAVLGRVQRQPHQCIVCRFYSHVYSNI